MKEFLADNWFEIGTFIIAVYGAILSTLERFKSQTKAKLISGVYYIMTPGKLVYSTLGISVMNTGKEDLFVESFGIKIKKNKSHPVLFEPSSILSTTRVYQIHPEVKDNILTFDNNRLLRSINPISPGQKFTDLYWGDQIEEALNNSDAKSFWVYIKFENGKKIQKKLNKTDYLKFLDPQKNYLHSVAR